MTESMTKSMTAFQTHNQTVTGEFVSFDSETYYAIKNVDQMPPFFISLVSDQDHWLFASSNGGLSAGRVSPDTALFPYVTVDKIYDSTLHTGPRTLIRVESENGNTVLWEPFNYELNDRFSTSRNLYKNELGNKLCYEEVNHDLCVVFRYTWSFSDSMGICRSCCLENIGDSEVKLTLLDGLQNILPAGTPRFTQTQSSNLVDAYKWTELNSKNNLALYTLYSAITDRAEPAESLRANAVFSMGLPEATVFISNSCVADFKAGRETQVRESARGIRGAYFVQSTLPLQSGKSHKWLLVANIELDQNKISELEHKLQDPASMQNHIARSIEEGSDNLARIMAAADGYQKTGEESVSLHHYANTLFNVLRGGIFADQYHIDKDDLLKTLANFNKTVLDTHRNDLALLNAKISLDEILDFAEKSGDIQLQRLVLEYLPITFGRRHGDPSRPWNQFAIELKDDLGQPLLSYQGNWRDIFQNWEALGLSYPSYLESVIAKFVNASTIDGYNPYRITKQGIDWEVEEPDDPWSYIGYWGDHQIIYLLKLLEASRKFHPSALNKLLHQQKFCYANVPYRIKGFDDLVANPKATVDFDEDLALLIEERVADIGADGKLILNSDNAVYQVTLLEKLLVPLLTKLSNLVVDGGIWLNTQRPEWNDANNALVGQGLSMVTLYYTHRYLSFMQDLLAEFDQSVALTSEVASWLSETQQILTEAASNLPGHKVDSDYQYQLLSKLGRSAAAYRMSVYKHSGDFESATVSLDTINELMESAQALIKHSIAQNKTPDGLYHAYNTIAFSNNSAEVSHLYPMLEGQVSVLSSGALSAEESVEVLETLFASDIYREDQHTFMLYPDREQSGFMNKNNVPEAKATAIPSLAAMLESGDPRIVQKDATGTIRFNSDFANAADLKSKMDELSQEISGLQTSDEQQAILDLYESVFNHQEFTGRSGGMFGFEGLGCIYWHMVSKLLLAAQECYEKAITENASEGTVRKLADLYYRVRYGIGFNKTPAEYGAFPTDPYSHTPKHAGAQQPGMTGQVKEELLTRMGELGCYVENGKAKFAPSLLRNQEFLNESDDFKYLDVNNHWQTISLAPGELAFTWCQVPIIYSLNGSSSESHLILQDGTSLTISSQALDEQWSQSLFARDGKISQIRVNIDSAQLLH